MLLTTVYGTVVSTVKPSGLTLVPPRRSGLSYALYFYALYFRDGRNIDLRVQWCGPPCGACAPPMSLTLPVSCR